MTRYPAILNLGFRLFFFSAAAFAVLTMLAWLVIYQGHQPVIGGLVAQWWHGHEMIYGYAAAVVTGFLFTAVLFVYWLPWFAARLLFAFAPSLHLIAAGFDLVFALGGLYAVAKRVVAVKQWRQMGLVSKMGLLAIGQTLFISGLLGFASGILWSLYLGVFTILAIVLTIGRRVTPFFTERGVGYPFTPKNSALLDRACLITFTAFFILKVFTPWQNAAAVFALATAACNGWRLAGWYTRGIWHRPLLWSMHLSLAGMLSGIGLLTLSMMARVSLGHSGRNIHEPPRLLIFALYLLCLGFICRILLPLAAPAQFLLWIGAAQVLWIVAFCLLLHGYTRIWFSPRIDGKPG